MNTKTIINLHLHINNTKSNSKNPNTSEIIGTKGNIAFLNPKYIINNLKKTSNIIKNLLKNKGQLLLITDKKINSFTKTINNFSYITEKPGMLTNKRIKRLPDIIILLGPLNSIKNKYIVEESKKLAIPTISITSSENFSKNISYINTINYSSSNISHIIDFILKYAFISNYSNKYVNFSKKNIKKLL